MRFKGIMVKKIILGVGINDADYAVTVTEFTGEYHQSGMRKYRTLWKCPFYVKWKSMIERVYSKGLHKRSPTYKGCTVCEEWLTFSNFRKWMVTKEWEDMHLDKDYLVAGNKLYSPETCVFVHHKINEFTIDNGAVRGVHLIGTCFNSRVNSFQANCSDPFNRHTKYIGMFKNETEAHLAWKKKKHEYACELADSKYVTDVRIQEVLRNKYKNFTLVEEHIR